tara:strand:+ start:131 stop:430 length:300 start_codon:yes stop_codon:yes gene_type:complete
MAPLRIITHCTAGLLVNHAKELMLRGDVGPEDRFLYFTTCGCFVGSTPLLPVRRGEIQCSLLGVDAIAYGEDGSPVEQDRGELVCRQPLPSMPVAQAPQ